MLPPVFGIAAFMAGWLVWLLIRNRHSIRSGLRIYTGSPKVWAQAAGLVLVAFVAAGFLMQGPAWLRMGWLGVFTGMEGNAMFSPLMAAYADGGTHKAPGAHPPLAVVTTIGILLVSAFWAFLMTVFAVTVPEEEAYFRAGRTRWPAMLLASLRFGFIHMILGIPVAGALVLSGLGLTLAGTYRRHRQRWLAAGLETHQAEEKALLRSEQLHGAFNALIVTLLAGALIANGLMATLG